VPDLRPGCTTGNFREDTAPADALVDEFKVQCPLPHVVPPKMYRENSPRLRFSRYSELNVDTED
jgi:hypothetical protein